MPALSEKEMQMINMMNSIDFSNSRLPEEVKNRKTIKEGQKFSDLELSARAFEEIIKLHPMQADIDTDNFDDHLLAIINIFQSAVDRGNCWTAEYARTCLLRAIRVIRPAIPTGDSAQTRHFIERNTIFLDDWIKLLFLAEEHDETVRENKKQNNRCIEEREHAENLKNLIMSDINDETFPCRDLILEVYVDVLTSEGKEAETIKRMEAWDDLQWKFFFLICGWTDSVLLHRLDTSLHEEMTLQAEEREHQLLEIYGALVRLPNIDVEANGEETFNMSPTPSLHQGKTEADSGKREKAQCILEELQSKYGLLSQVPIENIEMRKEALNKMEELKKKILQLNELLEKQEIPPKDLPNHQAVLGIVREFLEGWEKELMLSQLFNQPEEDNEENENKEKLHNEEVLRSMSGPDLRSYVGIDTVLDQHDE